ncbi:hypothetical protein [Actinoplanes utahensis]|uniref:hypothetical protein n=1 Tax=Actinoplanes utahensis TaxID=1869 RepID=UPI00191BEB4E|nr:hypothetical protein [Actinoplanes utahensis]
MLLDDYDGPGAVIPALVTAQAPSYPVEERWAWAATYFTDPLLHGKANSDWYRISLETGLFSETDPRFLMAYLPGEDGPSEWLCVELQEDWDIMGTGAAALLGSAWCRPEFRFLSLDGSVLVSSTTGEDALDTFAAREPDRSSYLPRYAAWLATLEDLHPGDVAAIRRWLQRIRWS